MKKLIKILLFSFTILFCRDDLYSGGKCCRTHERCPCQQTGYEDSDIQEEQPYEDDTSWPGRHEDSFVEEFTR